MSTEWQVGDLAECLGSKDRWVKLVGSAKSSGPDIGEINRVTGLLQEGPYHCLQFHDRYGSEGYVSTHFRKVKPPAIDDGSKEQWEELLKDYTKAPEIIIEPA